MQNLNKTQLIGNVGQDPELKYGQSGTALLRLRIATNEKFTTKEGEQRSETEWHTVTVFGKRAEGLAKVLKKGAGVYVEGKLKTHSWEDDSGVKHQRTEIIMSDLKFLTSAGGKPAAVNESEDFSDEAAAE